MAFESSRIKAQRSTVLFMHIYTLRLDTQVFKLRVRGNR